MLLLLEAAQDHTAADNNVRCSTPRSHLMPPAAAMWLSFIIIMSYYYT
jgi:hypothetical protein